MQVRSLNWDTTNVNALGKYQDQVSLWATDEICTLVADVFLLLISRVEEFIESTFIDFFLERLVRELVENRDEFFSFVGIEDFTECVEALVAHTVRLSAERKRHRDTYFFSEL